MEFKISSDFDYECVPETLLCTYDFDVDDIPSYLDENKSNIEKLSEYVYFVFIACDIAFTFTVNCDNEIVDMCEVACDPKNYCYSNGLLLVMSRNEESYYSAADLYRVTSTEVERLMSVDND